MSDQDAKIIEKILAGDVESYSEIVEQYSAPLAAVAYSRTFDHESARDIAQDALIEAYKNLRKLEKKETFPGWLYNIARNKAVSWLRRKGAEKRALEVKAEKIGQQELPQHRSPMQLAADKEITDKVLATLEELSEDYREIVLLRYYSGLGREEAAGILGISLDAADKRLQRALAQLRNKAEKIVQDKR